MALNLSSPASNLGHHFQCQYKRLIKILVQIIGFVIKFVFH